MNETIEINNMGVDEQVDSLEIYRQLYDEQGYAIENIFRERLADNGLKYVIDLTLDWGNEQEYNIYTLLKEITQNFTCWTVDWDNVYKLCGDPIIERVNDNKSADDIENIPQPTIQEPIKPTKPTKNKIIKHIFYLFPLLSSIWEKSNKNIEKYPDKLREHAEYYVQYFANFPKKKPIIIESNNIEEPLVEKDITKPTDNI